MNNSKLKAKPAANIAAITGQAMALRAFSRRLGERGHATDSEKNEYADLVLGFGLTLAAETRKSIMKNADLKDRIGNEQLLFEFKVLANADKQYMKPMTGDGFCDCPGGRTVGEAIHIDERGNGNFTFTIPRRMGGNGAILLGGLEIDLKKQTVSVTYPDRNADMASLANVGPAFAKYCEAVANWMLP